MIPSATLHLLNQDNSVPGNRKDGFRYDHLLFVMIATPLYLWLELSFGVRLLDQIGGQVIADDTAAIEHWGRLISGLAVSLLFLTGWVRQCEKLNTPWPARIGVGIAISLACICITWWAQDRVIDFYVNRSNAEINISLRVLAGAVLVSFLVLRAWIRYAVSRSKARYLLMGLGLVIILLIGRAVIWHLVDALPSPKAALGLERQQAATLTLVRRGLEEQVYALDQVRRDDRAIFSPEGKAFLALFPIFGTVLDQERFARDRPDLLRELMYRDWDTRSGAQAFGAYQDVVAELRAIFDGDYANKDLSQDAWDRKMRELLKGPPVTRGLDWKEFSAQEASQRFMRLELGCFDCEFSAAMDRQAFGRELFKWTQKHNVQQAIDTFASSEHFEEGRDGERAARAYWVPIWALLFSMVGAFTHIFKLIFTVTEYAHRRTFRRIHAADSPLANQVIANSRAVTAAVVLSMGLVIYFADNRITGHEAYSQHRSLLWKKHPIAGGLAAHWTVNAQGFFYPFTSRIRPSWLTFNNDPLAHLPFVSRWIAAD